MFAKTQRLDVSPEELAVIEAALETQAKILSVQAGAGGSGARRRLNEVKKVLTRVEQHTEGKTPKARRKGLGWFGLLRPAS